MEQIKATVQSSEQNARLDLFVHKQWPELSRSAATKLISSGQVCINKSKVLKPSYKVQAHDQVIVNYAANVDLKTQRLEMPVIYEDDDCLVINKPTGILTHSKGIYNDEATVASWLSARLSPAYQAGQLDKQTKLGIVHRLDRATSGIMICAKHETAHKWLQKQFAQRKVKKTYIALVSGLLHPPKAIIDMPIERNPKAPATFRAAAGGKPAITQYEVIKTANNLSLLKLSPQTGRTHQIRVHLKTINHPIVGDQVYGGLPARRLFLHAEALEITLFNRERQNFEVKTPAIFYSTLKNGVNNA